MAALHFVTFPIVGSLTHVAAGVVGAIGRVDGPREGGKTVERTSVWQSTQDAGALCKLKSDIRGQNAAREWRRTCFKALVRMGEGGRRL